MATAPIDEGAAAGVVAVIVNYRTPELTLACLGALAAERGAVPGLTAMVVEGGSADGSAERLAEGIAAGGWSGWVRLLSLTVNGGFGYANNQAILTLAAEGALPPFVLLINPDARVEPGAITALMARMAAAPRVGAVGALLLDEAGGRQGSAFAFPSVTGEFLRGASTGFVYRLFGRPEPDDPIAAGEVDWVTGAAVLLRTAALAEVGLFDDGFFLYFEEVELMARLRRAGWSVWHEPAARVAHVGGAATHLREGKTGGRAPLPPYLYQSRRRFFARAAGGTAPAALAFVAGRLLLRLRLIAQRRPNPFPRRSIRDTLRLALRSTAADRVARPPRLGDAAGRPPAWQVNGR